MLNIEQTAAYLHMSVWSLKNHIEDKRLPPAYMPTRHRFLWDKADLDLWNRAGRNMEEFDRRKSLIDLSE